MKKAASRLSATVNFDAIHRHQFLRARCNRHEKLAPESGVKFMAPVSAACVRGSSLRGNNIAETTRDELI